MEDDAHSFWLYMPCGLVRIARSELDAWAAAVDQGEISNERSRSQFSTVPTESGALPIAGGYTPHVAKSIGWKIVVRRTGRRQRHRSASSSLQQTSAAGACRANHCRPQDLRRSFRTNGHMRLPPLVRDLEIDYTALSLVAPEKIRFRYKLEGFDRDWQDAGNRRQAFYTNLPPRNYRFRVIACNNSGVWNEAGRLVRFLHSPGVLPDHLVPDLCAAAFLALLWAFYQLRLQQLRHQFNIGLEARVNERTRIARELHDTLLQSFQGAVFQFQAARKLLLRNADNAMQAIDEAIQAAEEGITEGRAAIHDLRPEPAAQRDLPELLNAAGHESATAQQPEGHASDLQRDRRRQATESAADASG